MISISSCPICSSSNFSHYLNCKDYTTTGESFNLKTCESCGFTFTDPRPDKEDIGNYYLSDKYISHTGGKKTLFDLIYLLARKLSLRNKRRIVERIANTKSVLDFGCGTGEFLKEMQKSGWHINGIEPSSLANQKAKSLTNIVINNSVEEIKDTKFAIITLWHVLEHLHDLNESLRDLKEMLNESGTILIAVPNLKSHDASKYQEHWAAYDVPRHLWHFNQSNMTQLLQNHGFTLKEIIPMKMDSFYVSLLSETYHYTKRSAIINSFNALYTGFISNLKARKTKNYSSLIYIAKK